MFPQLPIIFIAHSMGGLVAKQVSLFSILHTPVASD